MHEHTYYAPIVIFCHECGRNYNDEITTGDVLACYPCSVRLSLLFPQIVPERITTKSLLKHATMELEGGFPPR